MQTIQGDASPVNEANDNCAEREVEFTSLYRWQHWIRALSITVLIVTGFYIADPFLSQIPSAQPDNFMQALIRSWHIIFGFALTAAIMFKSYLFIFGRKHQMEREAIRDLISPKIWIQQIGYYLLISKHPKLSGVYNPIQFVAYIAFYIMMFVLIVTGFVLYAHVYHEGFGALIYEPMTFFEVLMGGIANARQIHHIAMWGVIIFILAHVYMAVFNAVFGKEGAMDAIFSGNKWHKKH